MRKLVAICAVLGLCTGFASAGFFDNSDDQPYQLTNGTFSTAQSTPIARKSELVYIIVESTGANAGTITVRDGTTDKLSVSIATSAGTEIIDLTATPVLFSSSINLSASVTDGGVSYTIIYRRVD